MGGRRHVVVEETSKSRVERVLCENIINTNAEQAATHNTHAQGRAHAHTLGVVDTFTPGSARPITNRKKTAHLMRMR